LLSATHEEDARFGPAWICFAHCFAYEGEHDLAITAYSTTARLFPGYVVVVSDRNRTAVTESCFLASIFAISAYLPMMCIGMEYIQLNDMPLALDALHAALALCSEDALLFNEIGIVYYDMGR
jgi:anaphase-promoting complex subunit 6